MAMREVLRHKAERYRERRDKALQKGNAVLDDGRQSTVGRKVLDPSGSRQWPTVEAAILQGSQLPGTQLYPAALCPRRSATWIGCHDAYLFTLYDSAAPVRTFDDLAALAIYLAPLNEIVIVWIGLESDVPAQTAALVAQTSNWTDMAVLSPPAHALLAADCRFY
jgi:hypothetical protein